jgi:predicted phage terminase large subunit-like protein
LAKGGKIEFRLMGGGNTGYPSHISLIDDPYRNREDAHSPTIRAKIENRFRGDIMSRRQNLSMAIVLHSRHHTNDLIGMLKSDGYFKHIIHSSRHPALGADGEPLFPELRSKSFLMEQKGALGAANFEALYQQNPVIQGGNLIKSEWFRKYNASPERFDKTFIIADTALTESKSADNSAFLLCGLLGSHIYLLDGYCRKVEFPDLRRDMKQFWLKANDELKTRVSTIYVENKGSGISLIQMLRKEDGLPVSELYPTYYSKSARRELVADKYTRFQEISADLESGYVYVPETAGWMLAFLAQCEAFTGGKQDAHDDYVDCLMYALKERRKFMEPKWEEPVYGAMKW